LPSDDIPSQRVELETVPAEQLLVLQRIIKMGIAMLDLRVMTDGGKIAIKLGQKTSCKMPRRLIFKIGIDPNPNCHRWVRVPLRGIGLGFFVLAKAERRSGGV
jgi:hypothetical protein